MPDAGANYPPVIDSSNPDMPGPVTLTVGTNQGPFTISVEDKDLGDTLYVRVFRDYDPEAPLWPFEAPPKVNDPLTGLALRTIELETNTWCNQAELNTALYFDVMVADRPFAPLPAEPAFKALPADAESSERSWVIICQE